MAFKRESRGDRMRRTGDAVLRLHGGQAPGWLISRMKKLASALMQVMIDEYGAGEVLRRLSNPFWFQCLSNVLGYDFDSSGSTTVVCGVLKTVIDPDELGLAVAGGKGKRSLKTPVELEEIGYKFELSDSKIKDLKYASRMCAKVDNAAIQAGYPLYHHAFLVSERGDWAVVQQGMNTTDRTARRYHWLSENVKNFVVEPHNAIVCNVVREAALDTTAMESEPCRRTCVDLVKEGPGRIARTMRSLRPKYQKSLLDYFPVKGKRETEYVLDVLSMPKNINWSALRQAYEFQPENYEGLLGIRGIGPATVRGLALVSDLIYGEPPSYRDPVKYSFAFGGKDGVPWPVKIREMDQAITFLEDTITQSKLGQRERINALKRLKKFVQINRLPVDTNRSS